MNLSRALLGGALGGIVMSVLMFIARLVVGMDVNLEMMMGTVFLDAGPVAWLLGFAMHVMLSALIALAYSWGFETVTKRANVALGAAFSVVHILIAGVVMGGMIPVVHRLIPEQMEGPGYFLANHGTMGVIAFVLLHVIYGAIVGATYAGHVRRPRLTASMPLPS